MGGGVPEGSRTPDPWFRKPVLYPAELPGQSAEFGAYPVLGRGRRRTCA